VKVLVTNTFLKIPKPTIRTIKFLVYTYAPLLLVDDLLNLRKRSILRTPYLISTEKRSR